ncbi:MAG: T9SS C-terminal target domain-containing protein [Bacteroidetes bacterium]|nr:MAG: T9SS C-terminal target domain-containing protein [Bacteroidota bacterium]
MKLLLIISACLLLEIIQTNAQDTVTIDTAIHHQTMAGWGHGGGVLGHVFNAFNMLDSAVANPANLQLLDYLVDDLGLSGSRTWEVGPRIDGTGMDNGDCDSIDWTKFQGESLPLGLANYLVHYQARILSKGYDPSFYSSPGYPTHATDQKPWILYNPGERAQQIWASSLYMKNTYGIETNYAVIYNEPSGSVTYNILADDIKALGPRLIYHGLSTRSHYAEAVSPQTDWGFITPVQNDEELWSYIGRITYHNYGTADPYRSYIRDFGLSKGITTAQTEMGNPTFDDLYSDLTLGGVSYWEVAFSSGNTLVPISGLTSFTPSETYFRMRQLMHYVKPGSLLIGTTSNDDLLHVLAFRRDGKVTVVIENTGPSTKNVLLKNLPPGHYGLSKSTYGATAFQELGINTVGTGGTLTIQSGNGSTVTTLYPYPGTNQPPAIMTFVSNPGYLVAPSSTATLSATANDPELNTLAFHWTATSYPGGSNPVIVNPNSSSAFVSGLTEAGLYVFTIDVDDGVDTSTKKVFLARYNIDPPPVLGSCGFRIAAPYGLVFGNPGDTTHANIELPLSSVILQAGISDLANSDFTGMGTWILVQQPPGANAQVSATIYIYVSLRATVTGMTVPGDYVFQIVVNKPGYPILTAEIICTVHPPSSAPVITSITVTPPNPTLPDSTVLLTAVTSDPEGDLLRHWWKVNSVPAGTHPVFDHQCKNVTQVTGLSVPGAYYFTLRAFDDIHMTTKDITIYVNPSTGTSDHQEIPAIKLYPDPAAEYFIIEHTGRYFAFIVVDITGRTVLNGRNTFEKSQVDCRDLTSGIYSVIVTDQEGQTSARKLIIAK